MDEPLSAFDRGLREARAGSREALGQALEACRAYLLLVANREVDTRLAAKAGPSDVVQETFLEAQRDFAQFQGNTADELRGWLRKILLHNLSNFDRHYRTGKRQQAREVGLELESPSGDTSRGLAADVTSPSVRAMRDEQTEALERALARLPEDYSKIIVWRYREGRSFDEIAELMERSENAVRKLWFRAVERLEQELDRPT